MRNAPRVLFVFVLTVLVLSCRKWPSDSRPGSETGEASFVGIGNLGGGSTNVLVVLSGLEAGRYASGSITYRSATSTFTELDATEAGDTVRFAYSRSGTDYAGWALNTSTGLAMTFTQPSGITPFTVNRELDGFNMTGYWSGDMSSTVIEGQRTANLAMDQAGSLFLGSADVSFFEPWTFTFTSGTQNVASFQIVGSVSTSGGSYDAQFTGNYSGPDSIGGWWSAGSEGEIDGGEFLFTRSFQ